MTKPTSRAMAIALRTYHRPVKEGDTLLESWDQVVDRVVSHQRWLWERALNRSLNEREEHELEEVRRLILGRYMAGLSRHRIDYFKSIDEVITQNVTITILSKFGIQAVSKRLYDSAIRLIFGLEITYIT